MYKTILLPLDGSERAETILPYVRSLSEKYGSKIILLQVISPPPMLERDEVVDEGRVRSDREAVRRQARTYLDKIAKGFEKAVVVKLCVEAGSVVQAIYDAAVQEKADLVAMASHGWGGSRRTFYGSVTSGVINKTDRPLFLIRSRGLEE